MDKVRKSEATLETIPAWALSLARDLNSLWGSALDDREIKYTALVITQRARGEVDRFRNALLDARQFINDWGPDEPGKMAAMTNDQLAVIDNVVGGSR